MSATSVSAPPVFLPCRPRGRVNYPCGGGMAQAKRLHEMRYFGAPGGARPAVARSPAEHRDAGERMEHEADREIDQRAHHDRDCVVLPASHRSEEHTSEL